jgi:hypothetical protein
MKPDDLKYIKTCANKHDNASVQKLSCADVRQLLAERAELLEALDLLLYGAEQAINTGLNQPQVNGGVVMARAALAKARGEA